MDYSVKENEPSYMMEYIINVMKLEENKRRAPHHAYLRNQVVIFLI
jgi:hypothetical protein